MYQGYISTIDWFLIPLYFGILLLIMLWIRSRHPDKPLYKKYLIPGFVFKIGSAILYCMLIYYYWGFGDSINYFKNVVYMRDLVARGNENWSILFQDADYLRDNYSLEGTSTEAGWLLERIAFVLSYLSFGRFVTTSMLFAFIAYAGIFKMLETFATLLPDWKKYLAWGILFFPTVGIYGSGILKDTLCIAGIGWIMYINHQFFYLKKFRIQYLLILVLAIYLIYQLKTYIILAFAFTYFIYLLMLLVKRIKFKLVRTFVFPVLIFLLFLMYNINSAFIDQYLGNYAIEKLFENVKEQQQSYLNDVDVGGSTFNLGTIEPTWNGFISKMPEGINATLYRPYLWEAKNVLMIFSALENLVLLLFTIFILFKCGIFRSIRILFTNPMAFLCVFYALIFAAIIGLSTSNFGTLGRYRIPVIPLFIAGLLTLGYEALVTNPKKPHERTE